jgi:tripeptidyl-peptidase-1
LFTALPVCSGKLNRFTNSHAFQWLAFDATTEEVENLLHAEYYNFEHSSADRVAVACDE